MPFFGTGGSSGTGSDSSSEPVVPTFVDNATADIIPINISLTSWAVSTGDATTGTVLLNAAEYTQIGNLRYYRLRLSAHEDSEYSFGVQDAVELIPMYQQHWREGSGDFAAGQASLTRVGSNELQINRDDNIDVRCTVDINFLAVM